jgi:hypothetical protein
MAAVMRYSLVISGSAVHCPRRRNGPWAMFGSQFNVDPPIYTS